MKRTNAGFWLSIATMLMLSLFFTNAVFANASSKRLTENIRSAISSYYPDQNFDIKVSENGVVEIRGDVDTMYDKLRIFEIVSKVHGVRVIKNLLVVDTPIVPDKVIEADIIAHLKVSSKILEPDRIKVKVTNGVVFLSGEVSFFHEKLVAQTVASWEKGVKGIVNEIKVLPPHKAVSDENLKVVLGELLKHQFSRNKTIKFTVKNGVVTVTGTAYNLWEKRKIVEEFSRVPGVKEVINQLKVEREVF